MTRALHARRVLTLVVSLTLAGSVGGCTDVERCRVGTEGCVCNENEGCADAGLVCESGMCVQCRPGALDCVCTSLDACLSDTNACVEGRCIPRERSLCLDACRYANDGACDDGGEGSTFSLCTFGTDCADCGTRLNPCVELNPDYPVFCPQTPDVEGGQCWGPGTFCAGLSYCEEDDPRACLNELRYDCDANAGAGGCVANPCTTTGYPTFCPYEAACLPGNADCCFPANVDCRTVAQCGTSWFTCWTGEMLDCGTAAAGDERCVLATSP